jgi:hypothetical protein
MKGSILNLDIFTTRRKSMKSCKAIPCVLGFVVAFIFVATAADTPKLTFKFTTVNVPGAVQTFPGGVNNAGVTVGQYVDSSSAAHGYILRGKKLTTLDDPNGIGTTGANNLNPDGPISVVGSYVSSAGNAVGFLYKNRKYMDIPGPTGSTGSAANAINDNGAIVGDYDDSNGVSHGFLLKGKKYTTLDVPNSVGSIATGINKNGWIVLYWVDSSGALESSLTRNSGKTYKTINVPGATNSAALDLNTAGDVTYQWFDTGNVGHGALLHAGKYYKVDHPRSVQTYAGGINDMGVIDGGFQATSGGPVSGYKATYK